MNVASEEQPMSLIDELGRMVEEACLRESNAFGYGIWSHHIVVVARYGKRLAERLGADAEIVEIAALLHDYAGIKDVALEEEHHVHSAKEAERILNGLGYPADRTEAVKHCIYAHRASKAIPRESLEAVCLASADAMAHIDQVASLLYYAYTERRLGIDEGAAWVKHKIDRSWKKLCPQAKEMIKGKYGAATTILGS